MTDELARQERLGRPVLNASELTGLGREAEFAGNFRRAAFWYRRAARAWARGGSPVRANLWRMRAKDVVGGRKMGTLHRPEAAEARRQVERRERVPRNVRQRIARLLSLSSSPNPNEARAARQQAEALLERYDLTTADIEREFRVYRPAARDRSRMNALQDPMASRTRRDPLQRRSGTLIEDLIELGSEGELAVTETQTQQLLEYLLAQHGPDIVVDRLAHAAAAAGRRRAHSSHNRRVWASIGRVLRNAAAQVRYIYERS